MVSYVPGTILDMGEPGVDGASFWPLHWNSFSREISPSWLNEAVCILFILHVYITKDESGGMDGIGEGCA